MTAQNREQRRRDKFGRTGVPTKDQWPQSSPNPVFGVPDDQPHHEGHGSDTVTEADLNETGTDEPEVSEEPQVPRA